MLTLDVRRATRWRSITRWGSADLGLHPEWRGLAGPAVQRDGRDARRGRRPAGPGQAAGGPPRRPGPSLDSLRGRADRARNPGRGRSRSTRTRSRVAIHNRGPLRAMKPLEAAGLRRRRRLRRIAAAKPRSPGRSRSKTPTSAGSRPSRSTASNGSSTARRSRPSSGSARSRWAGSRGRSGSCRFGPLLRDGEDPAGLLTDPIILDNFTHLLGGWGLDRLADDGDVIFPLRMGELAIFGDAPAEGSDVLVPDRDPRARAAPGRGSTPTSSAPTAGPG